jgi:hypothetical protein
MRHLLTSLALLATFAAAGQVEVVYPYNPDGNADSVISAPDLLDLLPIFGGTFTPEEITVNGEGLSTVLEEMQTVLDSLSSANGGADGQVSSSQWRSRDWPLGFDGRIINHAFGLGPFEVPADSILFLTSYEGHFTYTSNGSNYSIEDFEWSSAIRPLPIGSLVTLDADESDWFSGVLVAAQSDFHVLLWDFANGDFLIPEGSMFVPRWTDGNWGQYITGFLPDSSLNLSAHSPYSSPTFVGESILSDNNDAGGILGYLVPQDWFRPSEIQSSLNVTGLAFGEKVFLDFDSMKSTTGNWALAAFKPSTDGFFLFISASSRSRSTLAVATTIAVCLIRLKFSTLTAWSSTIIGRTLQRQFQLRGRN